MISIIIRSRNEERWIGLCLKRLLAQDYREMEVILVDNASTDKTVERARQIYPDLKMVTISRFSPGFALNKGIAASSGDLIVCLSAHCLPVRNDWLDRLRANFDDPKVAGVYGRQIPLAFSNPFDKRDLLVTFGLDRRVQKRDTFFHNANSMIRREVWQAHPFDEEVTNIEDRVWAKEVIEAGYVLVYEPEAVVSHYHGIHQENDAERCGNAVRIMETQGMKGWDESTPPFDPSELEVAAIIPIRSHRSGGVDSSRSLITQTLAMAKAAQHIDRIIVSTDSREVANMAEEWGVEAPFLRPVELSGENVRADEVLNYSLDQLEQKLYYPDLVVPMEITYPFRPKGLPDKLIRALLGSGLDTVVAGFREYRPCWIRREQSFVRIDQHGVKRDQREPLHVGLPSLGCVTYPEFIRAGTRFGPKVGVVEIEDPLAAIEVRSPEYLGLLERVINSLNHPGSPSHPREESAAAVRIGFSGLMRGDEAVGL